MNTKLLRVDQLEEAVSALHAGQVIAFPTETVFGLGVIFDDEAAYKKLVEVKRRPPTQPFTLMCGCVEEISNYAVLDAKTEKIVKAYMPGALTIIVKVKEDVPSFVTLNTGFIGIRVSESKLVQDLIKMTGKPLLVPSANKHGEPPTTNSEDALYVFNGEIPYVIEGKSVSNIPSTIIKNDGKIELIREGGIPFKQILETAGRKMKIAIGADHGGFEYKQAIVKHLEERGIEVLDFGTHSKDSVHYPIYGIKVGEAIRDHKADLGIVVCTSGEGITIAANKVAGVRAGIAYNDDVASKLRTHNDANVVGFGQGQMELVDVLRRVDIFLESKFEGGRHQTRVDIIDHYND